MVKKSQNLEPPQTMLEDIFTNIYNMYMLA